ncbi:RasGEF domain containing protein [Trichomonas vaginalis G3]|uniref:RasGEF domain containing protein n=1 Tax=Trichomonas vaginalis (strain ATCC PRA-98 / G3) TaxID=412133 RepID=A2ELJ3_TRIV3|nr:guanyl-nucleotide exchange factor protein [Trichomonas vaginalis G3]EAY06440.1 RasGEF domain containing protein [Trichomonas vaginalis G3]KAI5548033.1 guanyl-nucleotide exchange factor protein [Trichomonas vaginalis G3]|eukprot:XP_001318663.1 RasGEF domain containing protein [Trichomonas vaginalis G3]
MSEDSSSSNSDHHHKHSRRVKQRVIKYRLRSYTEGNQPKASSQSTIEKYLNDVNDASDGAAQGMANANRTLLTLYDMLELDQETREFCKKLNFLTFPNEAEWKPLPESPDFPSAASLSQLLLCLTDPIKQPKGFQVDFIITIPTFTTPNIVLGALFTRFFADVSQQGCNIKDDKLNTIRTIIINIIKATWIRYAAYQLENPKIFKAIEFFAEAIMTSVNPSLAMVLKSAIKTLEGKSDKVDTQKVEYDFVLSSLPENEWTLMNIPEIELARQLNYFFMMQFRQIQSTDILATAWGSKKEHNSEKFELMINYFNDFSCFVSRSIINASPDPHERARVIKRWVDIAYICLNPEQQDSAPYNKFVNYHAVFAIMYGVTHPSINRLTETQKFATRTNKVRNAHIQEMNELINQVGNFKVYKEKLANTARCLPFVGVLQKELVYITEMFPNTIDGLINFKKCTEIVKFIRLVESYQESPNIIPHKRIQDLIQGIPKDIGIIALIQESQKAEPSKK